MKARLLAVLAIMVLISVALVTTDAVGGQWSGDSRLARPDEVAGETPAPPSAWSTQSGGFHYVNRLQAIAANSVWVVGSHAVHFDGRIWRAVDRRDYPAELYGVSVLGDGTGWIVGDEEEAIPVRGGVAMASTHVPGYRFRDVATVGDDEAWALATQAHGSRSVILHYRDGTWTREWLAPPRESLSSIWMASPNEGWAVGSTAAYYSGESWTEWSLPRAQVGLNEVRGTGPNDVWAVGGTMPFPLHTPRRAILHFDGTGWSVVRDEEGAGIYALAVRPGEGYAVTATGDVLGLRNGRWEQMNCQVPASTWPESPVWVAAASFVPGAPYALVATSHGSVYRLAGDQVTPVRQASTFTSVAMIDDRRGWVLGDGALQYDGSEWRALSAESVLHRATDIAAAPDGDAWAVGAGGLVAHYAQADWQPVAFPEPVDLQRVALSDAGRVWVLGQTTSEATAAAESVVYVRGDGGDWTASWKGPGTARDLAGEGAKAAVATSEGVWTFDGRSWAQSRQTGAMAVGIGPEGELWAGDEGEIQQLGPSGWATEAWLPARATVFAIVQGNGATWAVADYGYVLAHDGEAWRIVRGEADFDGHAGAHYGLHDVAAVAMAGGATGLWAVGEPDTILHATEGDVLRSPAITPQPTLKPMEPMPTMSRQVHKAYLPAADRRPPYRTASCRRAAGASEQLVASAARTTARYYARGGPLPEPMLREMGLSTVAEIAAGHGVDLDGTMIGGQRLTADTCIWWVSFDGWFDSTAPGAPPTEPDYTWTRLDLALSNSDGSVLHEGFSNKAPSAPPMPSAQPAPSTPTAPHG